MQRSSGAASIAASIVALACSLPLVARAQTLEPPRVVTMPSIDVPEGIEIPEGGRVEVVVVVAVDGTATVDECTASEALCTLVREAMRDARFDPARRDGEAIPGRVRLALRVAAAGVSPTDGGVPDASVPDAGAPDAGAPDAGVPDAGPPVDAGPPPDASVEEPVVTTDESGAAFGATARVRAVRASGMRRLELAETRDLPGAFGDPFRAVDALPGVVPILSGLPYFFVRGAPPAGTLYVYDGIPVPTLYHLAVGPAVIHPRMVGPIRLYSGVAPARYGRLIGGVVEGEGPERPDGRTHAEAELRLLDISGYVQARALGGTFTAAIRYGYPALLLSIFSPEVTVAYWDYQLRYEKRFSSHDRFELVALGSYDSFGVVAEPENDVAITFHRMEPRFIRNVGRTEFGVALLLGWEQSSLGSGFQLRATRVGPRVWLEHKIGRTFRLRLSGDANGVAGSFTAEPRPDDDDPLGEGPAGDALFGDVPARSLWGLQAELGLRPTRLLELQLGARADAWIQGHEAEAVLDPRVRVILHATEELDFHLAGGVVHQPAVFYVPLPGIEDVAISRGLQTAIQSEAGVGWDLPSDVRIEAQAFLHHYDNLVFTDVLFLEDSSGRVCDFVERCPEVEIPERIEAFSYGAELFIRRAPEQRLSGWISYTLAWSDTDDIAGLPYTPTWDVRHVGNVVMQWNIVGGLTAGLRFHARSGKMHGEWVVTDGLQLGRDERRLPWFVRLDLQVAYAWQPAWGRMRISLEWFNATLAEEPIGMTCRGSPRECTVDYLPAIFFPNLGLRAEM